MFIALANLHQYLLVIGQQNLYVYITIVGVSLTVFSLKKPLRLTISYWNILHFPKKIMPTQVKPVLQVSTFTRRKDLKR
jgi:hypothetical protein